MKVKWLYAVRWRKGGLPGEDFEEKGRDIEEGKEAAKILVEAGYDALNADVGTYDSWYWNHPPMYFKKGMYLPYNEILKQTVDVPVITAGRMEDPDLASDAIREGKTDMIAMGRPLLADPEIPNKIMRGEFEEVRPCLSCQEGCMGRLQHFAQVSCAVNPACGRENEYGLAPTLQKKKILIAGGGVAGMEAARVAAIRGHELALYEKSGELGGNLIPGGSPDFKEDDHALIRWYERQLGHYNVKVVMNTAVDAELMKNEDPDEIILATGSVPKMLKIEGIEMLVTGKSEDGYVVKTPDGERIVAADSVICAIGYASNRSLFEEIKKDYPYVHVLGDANRVSNIMYAVWDAYGLARSI